MTTTMAPETAQMIDMLAAERLILLAAYQACKELGLPSAESRRIGFALIDAFRKEVKEKEEGD